MDPHFALPPEIPPGVKFPVLPIVTPDAPAPARSGRDKYGGLLYLGAIGLVVVCGLVAWFGWNAWSLRNVWINIYVLHDQQRSEADRVQAAFALGRDPRLNQRQRWDICLRKPLPVLARYLLAESLNAEAATADPRGYALTVARSPDWPVWLRLLLTRPLAYAAAQGDPIAVEPVRELRDRAEDPAIRLWADFALAAAAPGDPAATAALNRVATSDEPSRPLAQLLLEALNARGNERRNQLDAATLWLRAHHPATAEAWAGWRVEGDRLVPPRPGQAAPELH
jgi:hypothetical protein